MKNKIWVFGCSFSSGHLQVKKTESYGNLLAKDLNYDIENLARPGLGNDVLLVYLTEALKSFKEDDMLIFQFTSYNRKSYYYDENEKDYENFFTTAGLAELGIEQKWSEWGKDKFNKEMLENLLYYVMHWQNLNVNFTHRAILNLLDYAKNKIGMKVFTLFMIDEKFVEKPSTTVTLPIKEDPNNVSMNEYFISKKATISDEYPGEFFDSHPGHYGHQLIKNQIKIRLIKCT